MQEHTPATPFDWALLDRIMGEAGIDVLIANSKPNIQYLLGGYRFFFEHAAAIGQSCHLPLLVYQRERPDQAFYIGHELEAHQQEVSPLWVPDARNVSTGSADAMRHAVESLGKAGLRSPRIGAELAFLSADAMRVLRDAFPGSPVVDALPALERLRARKTGEEIGKLRFASEAVIAAMLTVIAGHVPGTTKRDLFEALRREQVARGLDYNYCLITMGRSLNRAPSEQVWRQGDILSLDSGGSFDGYIGDVCRMGILGEPDAELTDLLAEVDTVQQAAIGAARPGSPGDLIYHRGEAALAGSPHRGQMEFLAQEMGLVNHEIPHLTDTGPVPYLAEDADRPLEPGLVLSIETTLCHPRRGFIKLEDTVLVTEHGCEVLGSDGRGWNRSG